MKRLITAVVVGYFAIGALVVATDALFAAAIPGFKSMLTPPISYFGISLITDSLYSILGGYLCCLIAREHARTATFTLMIAGELIGIATQVTLWQKVPHWFALGLLILYPPAIWIGSRLRSRSMRSSPIAARA